MIAVFILASFIVKQHKSKSLGHYAHYRSGVCGGIIMRFAVSCKVTVMCGVLTAFLVHVCLDLRGCY